MLVIRVAPNDHQTNTTQCKKGEEWKRHWLEVEEMRESMARIFQVYGIPLNLVTYFKYLGCIIT